MAALVTLDGVHFYFDPTAVTAVADHDADTNEHVTTVYGLSAGRLRIGETPEIFLANIDQASRFKRFTRLDDTPVWLNCKAIKVIREPLAGEHPATARTVIPLGASLTQAVKEMPTAVVELVKAGGGNL
jgi:hypothetical protein